MTGTAGTRAGVIDIARQGWRELGACVGEDPRLWDLDSGLDVYAAGMAVCARCPVKAQCEDDAQVSGVYGVVRGGARLTHEAVVRDKWGKRIYPRVCDHCGAHFGAIKADARYCSKDCVGAHRREVAAAAKAARQMAVAA